MDINALTKDTIALLLRDPNVQRKKGAVEVVGWFSREKNALDIGNAIKNLHLLVSDGTITHDTYHRAQRLLQKYRDG